MPQTEPSPSSDGQVSLDGSINLLIDDLREELRERPYEPVSVSGG